MSNFNRVMEKQINLTSRISVGAIAGELDDTDCLNLIQALDLSRQDADFTIKVIKTLWKSLMDDLLPEEMRDLAKDLKRMAKGKE